MRFTHRKGKHRARPLYWLRWWPVLIRPRRIVHRVMFGFSAKYDLGEPDQHDVNKLFGVALRGIHRDSVRFGWRYLRGTARVELLAYVYRDGARITAPLCQVPMNHWYTLSIHSRELLGHDWVFRVHNENGELIHQNWMPGKRPGLFAFLLGPYFGGNRTAPHDIQIEIK